MSDKENKYGLKRYVPSDIRAKIRRDAGFGCVICGCVLVDYEHIDPEFSQAKEHNPEKMTLLCISCHGRVSRKIISKRAVWEAKNNPRSLHDGFVHDLLFVNTEEMEIKIGNSSSKSTKIILTICGKPIIWFEPPFEDGEPSKLCAIFYDENGKAISYVNRNQFTALSTNQDVWSKSTKLSITSNDVRCLVMDREGDSVLHISKMQGKYLDTSVTIDSQDRLIMTQGVSTLTIGALRVENCGSAIVLGDIPAIAKYNKLSLAVSIAYNYGAKAVLDLKNKFAGWIVNGEIFNRKYELVGFMRAKKVYSIANEFIGSLNGSYIAHMDDCYENGEPIFVSPENMEFKRNNPSIGYDVSFRLL
ncbi:HNH endonuclease [Cobetia sp. L2A1]|uniref:HNH endonuclease n=1 Tax=Cobetia sp. L2A1 TaxID=2686360 RepID=UPI00131E3F19|nr:HNH endonuclease signature motif containing protein [Cobetia sp. L2A1]